MKTVHPPSKLEILQSLAGLSDFETFAVLTILLMVGCALIVKWG